ncbi:MAG: adenylate/guanylate cyclase domain-containing protein [Chloroflexi bacterium]|nr:adenylate/guanylate cyclase domain-containing protein [Chloroflexota bacterium]
MSTMVRARAAADALIGRLAQVGANAGDDEDTRHSKALLVLISVLILPISLLWGGLYLAFGAPSGVLAFVYFVVSLGAIAAFARTRDFSVLLRIELLDILLAPNLSMIPLGGFITSTGVGVWGILAPMGALVFGGVRSGIRWYVAFLAVFLGSGVVGEILANTSPLPAWFTTTMLALNIAVGGTMVFTLLALFAKQRQDALAALRVEQDKADNLLLNILPRSIANRLKADSHTIADQFGAASILFADVVDFTPFSEDLPPAEVVGVLDHLFSHFDDLAERYEVEKIKTIGDCYMVAAGVPTPRPDHAQALAGMALDMVEAMRTSDEVGHLGLELRIGINSGPVVAGVIGRKRFLYDLWGDAVNTASRMESQGTPGRVQITRATHDLIADEFECEPRGTIAVKGKGDMDVWHVVGRRPQAVADDRPDPAGVVEAALGG